MAPVKEVAENGRSERAVVHLTQKALESLSPKEKPYLVRDDEIKGLVVKIYPTGTKTFFLDVLTEKRHDMFKIGQWPDLNIAQIREKAKKTRARTRLACMGVSFPMFLCRASTFALVTSRSR